MTSKTQKPSKSSAIPHLHDSSWDKLYVCWRPLSIARVEFDQPGKFDRRGHWTGNAVCDVIDSHIIS